MKIFLYTLLLIFVISCGGPSNKEYVENWIGNPITVDKSLVYTKHGLDTVDYSEYSKAKTKMFIYVDSVGCTSCKLMLTELIYFREYLKKELKQDVPVLLYFDNIKSAKVATMLRTFKYDAPVCIDTKGELSKRYEFSNNLTHNAFLLDSLNRVILVGYPMHNKEIEKMYIDEILRRN